MRDYRIRLLGLQTRKIRGIPGLKTLGSGKGKRFSSIAIFSRSGGSQGIGFAIPANLAHSIMDELVTQGRVIRGWLGVQVEPRLTTDGGGQALLITDVTPDSPAARAGVLPGDVITHIDNELVVDGRQTKNKIAFLRPGDTIEVTVQRDNQTLDLKAIVGTLRESPSI